MRLLLTLVDAPNDLLAVDIDPTRTTIGQIADSLARLHRLASPIGASSSDAAVATDDTNAPGTTDDRLAIVGPARGLTLLERHHRVVDTALRSGQMLQLVPGAGDVRRPVGRVLIHDGPDAGQQRSLYEGTNTVGRAADADVQLNDVEVSRRHAVIETGPGGGPVRYVDLGSANGSIIEGSTVFATTQVLAAQRVTIGETTFTVDRWTEVPLGLGQAVRHNRPPRTIAPLPQQDIRYPLPAGPPQRPSIPLAASLAPLLMGAVMFAMQPAGRGRMVSVVFLAMSPLMAIGSVIEGRVRARRQAAKGGASRTQEIARREQDASTAVEAERRARLAAAPPVTALLDIAARCTERLWERHRDDPDFLLLRVGRGTATSQVTISTQDRSGEPADSLVEAARARFGKAAAVPMTVPLAERGVLGLTGDAVMLVGIARSLIAQIATLHSPVDVHLVALVSPAAAPDWHWLRWLPHAAADQLPGGAQPLNSDPSAVAAAVVGLTALVQQRLAARAPGQSNASHRATQAEPDVVLLVDDAAPIDRRRLSNILESGPSVGIYVLWLGGTRVGLPATCRAVIECTDSADAPRPEGSPDRPAGPPAAPAGSAGQQHTVDGASGVPTVRLTGGTVGQEPVVTAEPLSLTDADLLARWLAPIVELGRQGAAAFRLPSRVALPEVIAAVDSVDDLAKQWSINAASGGLGAVIGVGPDGTFDLDLRRDGPHALVAGTTGAGKSEFLQTFVGALAAAHGPDRLTFLLVDYKGGAAFGRCVALPHTVGLVTDLSPTEVRRALDALHAELHRRERLITESAGAKDLIDMERSGHPDTPPSLVIVVDEFAALARDVPAFVTGMVDVAQRGRSLGLHLVLATQRPAGVITDNIRANTNLRIALRMADEAESIDVVGNPDAAGFPPTAPGRAIARIGATTTIFQTAYSGGRTEPATARRGAQIHHVDAPPASSPVDTMTGPTDLERLTTTARMAFDRLCRPLPRRPWIDPMPHLLGLDSVARSASQAADGPEHFLFGLADRPKQQDQVAVGFVPDRDGSLLVLGASGSGKSAVLRTIAAVAEQHSQETWVYGLDFGGRALAAIEPLACVGSVVPGDDQDRVERVITFLQRTVAERASRYALQHAATIAEYRAKAHAAEPRIFLLLDDYAGFHSVYENIDRGAWVDAIARLATDGRSVGLHVIITADRRSAIPTALLSALPRRLVLRTASVDEHLSAGLLAADYDPDLPPGRGSLDGHAVQVALLGSDPSGSAQAAALGTHARSQNDARTPARPVGSLPKDVPVSALGWGPSVAPHVAIESTTLEPVPLDLDSHLVVAGPPGSGRTTALRAVAAAMARSASPHSRHWVSLRPSTDDGTWDSITARAGAAAVLADLVATATADPNHETIALFIDDLPDLMSEVSGPLEALLRLAKTQPIMIVASGDSGTIRRGYQPAILELRAARRALLLHPDPMNDGDIANVALPKRPRSWPPGRGYFVSRGRIYLVQWARPG